MPLYNNTPFGAPAQLLLSGGPPAYAFGSKAGGKPTTRMQVTTVAANAGNIATLGVKILEGPIPVAGNLISVIGTASASGAYNVSAIALTGVNIDATTGVGTVSFVLSTAQLATTADIGEARVPIQEVAEALTNNSSSVQFAIPDPVGFDVNAKVCTWQTVFTSQPAGITVALQGAMQDVDAQYVNLDTSTSVTGEIKQTTVNEVSFLRIRITGLGGAAPAGIIKLSI